MTNKLNEFAIAKPGTSMENKTGSWRTFKPVWKHDKCTGCKLCITYCPEGCVFGEGKGKDATYAADMDYCKGCGICAEECPVKDIEMRKEEK